MKIHQLITVEYFLKLFAIDDKSVTFITGIDSEEKKKR